MRSLIDQLEQSLGSRLYYLSLFAALTIPDIAGALDSDDGQANGARYVAWFDEWVRSLIAHDLMEKLPPEIRSIVPAPDNPLTGEVCYRFRCSLLHQGSSRHPKSPYARVVFIEPGATSNVIHGTLVHDLLVVDLPTFCQEVATGARSWLDRVEGTQRYKENYDRFARRHADGLRPHIVGVPVIG
jgi:hypothetical protein